MTDFAIQEQVNTVQRATDKAAQSKETALRFLVDAGIIEVKKDAKTSDKKKK